MRRFCRTGPTGLSGELLIPLGELGKKVKNHGVVFFTTKIPLECPNTFLFEARFMPILVGTMLVCTTTFFLGVTHHFC